MARIRLRYGTSGLDLHTDAPHVTVIEMRRQDLLADVARARLVSDTAPTKPSFPAPRPLALARAYGRYAFIAIGSVAFALIVS